MAFLSLQIENMRFSLNLRLVRIQNSVARDRIRDRKWRHKNMRIFSIKD